MGEIFGSSLQTFYNKTATGPKRLHPSTENVLLRKEYFLIKSKLLFGRSIEHLMLRIVV